MSWGADRRRRRSRCRPILYRRQRIESGASRKRDSEREKNEQNMSKTLHRVVNKHKKLKIQKKEVN